MDWLIDKVGSAGNAIRQSLPSIALSAAEEVAIAAALPAVGEFRGVRRVVAVAEATGKFLSENRHVRGVIAARKEFARIGATADEVSVAIAEASAWQSLGEGLVAGGRVSVGRGVVQYTIKSIGKEVSFNAWIPR